MFAETALLPVENDLPIFPILERASRHDMLSFLHTFFSMKSYLPEFHMNQSRDVRRNSPSSGLQEDSGIFRGALLFPHHRGAYVSPLPQGWNVPKGSAAVRKAPNADADENFHSLTATGDGILPAVLLFCV